MGPLAVIELVKQAQIIIDKRDLMWKHGSCIMLDVFMNRERHVYLKPLAEGEAIPNV